MMRPRLRRYAYISIGAALTTIALKGGAYLLTGSVGLLSDAVESLVNLFAAIVALLALSVAERPEDEEHAYGHTKAEYFASGFEGALIVMAAIGIAATAIPRLLDPEPVRAVGLGLVISLIASALNFAVSRVLFGAARRYDSIALEADAHHLMTDVWTSLAVVAGVWVAGATGWSVVDPILALAVAGRVVRLGVELLRRSMLGLLDTALEEPYRGRIGEILRAHQAGGVEYHALRTRQSGARRFVSFHILVPGEWTVQRGHDLLESIEEEIRAAVPNSTVFTHLEPLEDPASWEDMRLERGGGIRS